LRVGKSLLERDLPTIYTRIILETYREHKDYTTAIDINPHYITPKMLQFRLHKIMDGYVAGVATHYNTHEKILASQKRSWKDSRNTP